MIKDDNLAAILAGFFSALGAGTVAFGPDWRCYATASGIVFPRPELLARENFSLWMGIGLHELAHRKYTNFSVIEPMNELVRCAFFVLSDVKDEMCYARDCPHMTTVFSETHDKVLRRFSAITIIQNAAKIENWQERLPMVVADFVENYARQHIQKLPSIAKWGFLLEEAETHLLKDVTPEGVEHIKNVINALDYVVSIHNTTEATLIIQEMATVIAGIAVHYRRH